MILGKVFDNHGFTFLETIISIIILSAILAAFSPLIVQARKQLEQASAEDKKCSELLDFYQLVHEACQDTQIPFWCSSDALITVSENALTIPYLGGISNRSWRIESKNDKLVADIEGISRPCSVTDATVSRLIVDYHTVGVGIRFVSLGRNWEWREYFGSPGR